MEQREHLPRKLAAIVYADVAGYSRLTGEDEDTTRRRLSEYLDLIAEHVERHGGRVMHSADDAVLAMFDAVVDALLCAARIQRSLESHNAGLPEESKVQFRIGVNIGDVIEDRGDIYGDGVNVAARLESLAEPGGISISESVHTAVGEKLPLTYEYLGEQKVKNIAKPVGTYRVQIDTDVELSTPAARPKKRAPSVYFTAAVAIAVVVGGGLLAWLQPWQPRMEAASIERMAYPLPAEPSIAVLPFDNMSGDPDQEPENPPLTRSHNTTFYADPVVDLQILNATNALGTIIVMAGEDVEVGFDVTVDTAGVLTKEDLLQLVQVGNGTAVSSTERGKATSGSISLKVPSDTAVQLYVQYVGDDTGDVVARIAHPSDPDSTPLVVVAKANINELTEKATKPDGSDIDPVNEAQTTGTSVGADCTEPPNLIPGADLKNCDLLGADLTDAILDGADLSGANLTRANLTRANLFGALLVEANLSGANLVDADLSFANLSGAALRSTDLTNVALDGANLSGAALRSAILDGANLSFANLSGAALRNAILDGANLSGTSLHGADLHGAFLEGANLNGANLNGANLNGANLNGANLSFAILDRANLSGANLVQADLSFANLNGADLSSVFWDDTLCLDGTNSDDPDGDAFTCLNNL